MNSILHISSCWLESLIAPTLLAPVAMNGASDLEYEEHLAAGAKTLKFVKNAKQELMQHAAKVVRSTLLHRKKNDVRPF